MDKVNFKNKFESKIRTWVDWNKFLVSNVMISEAVYKISDFKDILCPWYYDGSNQGLINEVELVSKNSSVRPLKISEASLINLDLKRKQEIEEIMQNPPTKLDAVPIIIDKYRGKKLLLDSNHTCIALYEIFQREENDINIPVVEIRGDLDNIFEDIKYINR